MCADGRKVDVGRLELALRGGNVEERSRRGIQFYLTSLLRFLNRFDFRVFSRADAQSDTDSDVCKKDQPFPQSF